VDDWVLVSSPTGQAVRIANVIRVRSEIDSVTLYFERMQSVDGPQELASVGIELPERGLVRAVHVGSFEVASKTLLGATPRTFLRLAKTLNRQLTKKNLLTSVSCCNSLLWMTFWGQPVVPMSKLST